jgi:hypothetical protein
MATDETPVLRADALDDDLQVEADVSVPEIKEVLSQIEVRITPPHVLVCPVCGLQACRHNLKYVPREN